MFTGACYDCCYAVAIKAALIFYYRRNLVLLVFLALLFSIILCFPALWAGRQKARIVCETHSEERVRNIEVNEFSCISLRHGRPEVSGPSVMIVTWQLSFIDNLPHYNYFNDIGSWSLLNEHLAVRLHYHFVAVFEVRWWAEAPFVGLLLFPLTVVAGRCCICHAGWSVFASLQHVGHTTVNVDHPILLAVPTNSIFR